MPDTDLSPAWEAAGRQGPLMEGERVGRFVVLRDVEGRTHAIAAGSVAALCQTDEGTLVLLPGGRLVHVEQAIEVVLGWVELSFPKRR